MLLATFKQKLRLINTSLIDMKKLIPILCAAVLSSTSIMAHTIKPIKSSATTIFQEDRAVKDFRGIAAGGPIDVVVKMGNTESIRFEGDAEAISTLVTEVKSGVLIIRPKTSWTSWAKKYEDKKITAYVTAKNLNSLTMSGDGSLRVTGVLNGSNLSATLSGSGSITTDVSVNDLTSVVSGSGNINIRGKANKAAVTLSGSGRFAGKGLTVESLSTTISGSGIVNVQAESKIAATIVGSGQVIYTGDATVTKTVIGSGGVSKI
jgi:hypothetical protein